MSDPLTNPTGWTQDLCTRRNITLQVKGKRLVVHPKSAFNAALTTEERATLKQFRYLILDVLQQAGGTIHPASDVEEESAQDGRGHTKLGNSVTGNSVTGNSVTGNSVTELSEPAPEPVRCRWCHRAPCIGPEHDAYFDLHPLAEQARADAYATALLRRQVGQPLPAWWFR